jgi:hypothetical protein
VRPHVLLVAVIVGERFTASPVSERLPEQVGPELRRLQAKLAAQLPYRQAVALLDEPATVWKWRIGMTRVRIGLFQHALAHPEANSERFEGIEAKLGSACADPFLLFVASCLPNQFALSGKRYGVIRLPNCPARSRAAALAACLRRNHNGNSGSALIKKR